MINSEVFLANAKDLQPGSGAVQHEVQKGGALLEDMRLLVRSWEDGPVEPQREKGIVTNVLGKATRARAADVYRRIFLPRFVNGPLPSAWKLARALENELPAFPPAPRLLLDHRES